MCQHPSTATPKAKKHLDVSFKDVLKCKKIYFWSLLHFSCVVFIILTSILVGTSLFFTWLCLGNTSQRRIILKPPTDLKEYRHIQLENGLEAMLICDAHTSKVILYSLLVGVIFKLE